MLWAAKALTFVLSVMMSTLVVGVSAAMAAPLPDCVQLAVDPGYPDIPPPWQCDRSGSDQDTYYVAYFVRPGENGQGVDWRSGDQMLVQDREVSTGGVASMVITTRVYDNPTMSWVQGPTWTLNFGLQQTGPEAPNYFRFEIGNCNPTTKKVDVTPYFLNVDDSTERIVKRAYLVLRYSVGGQLVFGLPQFAENISDGHEAAVGEYQFYPGNYSVYLSYTENGTKYPMQEPLAVPACGGMVPPGTEPSTSSKPTARIIQMRSHKMKVVMRNRADRVTKFRLVINKPGPRGKKVKSFEVSAGGNMKRTFRRPAGTKFVVKATVPTQVALGTYKMKWLVIARKTMQR